MHAVEDDNAWIFAACERGSQTLCVAGVLAPVFLLKVYRSVQTKKTLLGEVGWEKGSTKTGTRTQDQLVKSQLLYR